MQLKAAGSAGRTLSAQSSGRSWPHPKDPRRRTLLQMIFRRVLPRGERENPWRTGGLSSTRANSLSKLTYKEIVASVGVSRAISLIL